MNHRLIDALGLVIAALLALGTGPAFADAVGPYYATPSWDQTLPVSTRFVVLSNFNGQAVLDRETGLVWQKSPDLTGQTWVDARLACANGNIGGRKGWRLPSLPEMMSLIDASRSNPALPAGHPFLAPVVGDPNSENFSAWTATTVADATFDAAWQADITTGTATQGQKSIPGFCVGPPGFCGTFYAWCVRGGMNADQY